jgi:hypothetical protein
MKNKSINNKSFILNNVTFNGNNRNISNLNLKNPLFSNVKNNCTIQNVNLFRINNIFIIKNEGLLTGCSLENVYAINKNVNSFMVSENYGTIKESSIINCNIIHNNINNISMGLLCGKNFGIIRECESKRNTIINKQFVAGGLVGYNEGEITKCYVERLINNSKFSGGLVGDINNGSNINDCQINSLNKNNIIFARALSNNFKINCIKINSNIANKYLNTDIMNNYKNNISNIKIGNNFTNKFTINNSNNCFSEMKIRMDNFMNTDIINTPNIIIFLIILLLLIITIYFIKFHNK